MTVVLHQLQELVRIWLRVTSPSRSRTRQFSTVARQSFLSSNEILITLVKQHGLFRVFTEDVEISVADEEEKSVEEIQAMGFGEDKIRKHFLAWNILSRAK